MLPENLRYPTVDQVQELFRWRCPKCRRASRCVHELEPRSRGKDSMRMQNRTAICNTCHIEYHKYGASEQQIAAWKEIIFEYLSAIGNWETYLNWGYDG